MHELVLSISVHKMNQCTCSVKFTCIRQLLSSHNVHFQAKALSIQLQSQQQQGETTAVVHWQLQTAVSFCVQRSETSFSGCRKWMWAAGNTYLSMSSKWNNLHVNRLHLTNDMAHSPLWLPFIYSDIQNYPLCIQRFFGPHALGQGQIYISLVRCGLTSVNLRVLYLRERTKICLKDNFFEIKALKFAKSLPQYILQLNILICSVTSLQLLHVSSTVIHIIPLLLPGVELINWKFWPSQRPLSISLDPRRRLSSFCSSFGKCPVWYYPPICTWVFLVIFWLEVCN